MLDLLDSTSALLTLRNRPEGRAVMHQTWSELTFMHWEVDFETVAQSLPSGLAPDTFHGKAYLSFVPFTMSGIKTPTTRRLQGVAFHEWNIRTYVQGPDGPGVWFYSLDASHLPAVLTARALFHLPYHHSRMSLEVTGDTCDYHCARGGRTWRSTVTKSGAARLAVAGTLEFWLVERYLLYSYGRKRLRSGRVHHPPYQLYDADVSLLEMDIPSDFGFPDLGRPLSAIQFSPGVQVEVFRLSRPLDTSDFT